MTVTEFCKQNDAYLDECGIKSCEWALAQDVTTMAELWELPMLPEWRIWIATRPGVLTPQQAVSWACRCVRRVWHMLTDERSRTAVETAERWARGEAKYDDLELYRLNCSARDVVCSRHNDCERLSAHAAICAICATYAAHGAYAYSSSYYVVRAIYAEGVYAFYRATAEREWQARELVMMFGNPFKKGE